MIRYKLDIMEKLKENEIVLNHYIKKHNPSVHPSMALSESTIMKLRKNDASISMSSLNTLCLILNCQPGDLIECVPEELTTK